MPRPVRRSVQPLDPHRRRSHTRARRAVKQAARLAAMAASSPHPALEIDVEGLVTCHNEAAQPIVDAINETPEREALQAEFASIANACLVMGSSRTGLKTFIAGKPYVWSFVPAPGGRSVHAYPIDVSRQEDLEARARRSDQLRSLGRLAGGIARSLSNHLTIIEMAGSELRSALSHPSPVGKQLEMLLQATGQAATLTRELRWYGRVKPRQRRMIDPREVAQGLVGLLRPLLPPGIELTVVLDRKASRVWADPADLRQILLDLVLDARDAMPGTGKLTLSTGTEDLGLFKGPRHIGLLQQRYLTMTVTDTGMGFLRSEFVDSPIHRARAARLAALHEMVRGLGGDIWIHPHEGRGTQCTVYLPEAASARRPAGEAVLLVEADRAVLRVTSRTLRQGGYRVAQASSAQSASRMASRRRSAFDLVVADLSTCAGTDLLSQIRSAHEATRILFLAGGAVPSCGVPILEKPFTAGRLLQAVRDTLDMIDRPAVRMRSHRPRTGG